MRGIARATYRVARRIAIAVVGGTLVLLGVVLIFTPGPAFVVLPAGLGVLALEFAWARRWLKRVRAMVTPSAAATDPAAGPSQGGPQSNGNRDADSATPRRGDESGVPLN